MQIWHKFSPIVGLKVLISPRQFHHIFYTQKVKVTVRGRVKVFLDPKIKDQNFKFFLSDGLTVEQWFNQEGKGKLTYLVSLDYNKDQNPWSDYDTIAILSFTDRHTAMMAKLRFGGNL